MRAHHPALNRQSATLFTPSIPASAAPAASAAPPSPEEILGKFRSDLALLDRALQQDWFDNDCADSHYASEATKELLWKTFEPVQMLLDRAFWDITKAQLAGEHIEEIPFNLWLLWDTYNNAHRLYSVLADSFDPAGMHERIAGARKRISERAERMRQARAAPPEPEETEEEEEDDDDTPVPCPRNCGDCGGLRYGCGLTRGDFRAARGGGAGAEPLEELEPAPEPEPVGPSPFRRGFYLDICHYPANGEGYEFHEYKWPTVIKVADDYELMEKVRWYLTQQYPQISSYSLVRWELRTHYVASRYDANPMSPTDHVPRWNTLDDLYKLPQVLTKVPAEHANRALSLRFFTEDETVNLVIKLTPPSPPPEEDRLAAALREAEEEERYEAWAEEERWRRQEQDREDYAREREEEERDEWDEWREGGGQGCGNCIDVCRCHCYEDY